MKTILRTPQTVARTVFLFGLFTCVTSGMSFVGQHTQKLIAGQSLKQTANVSVSDSTTLWSADHETGNFSQWTGLKKGEGGFYNTGTGVGTITSTVAHSGKYAVKLAISKADGKHGNQAVRLFRFKESRTYRKAYYSLWYYFPRRYTPAVWWNVLQFKSRNAERNDAFWQLNIGNRKSTGEMYFYLRNWITGTSYTQNTATIPIGKWLHLEVYYQVSGRKDGAIRVWQDGKLIFERFGVQTTFADAIETNWSVNNYTDNITPSTAMFYIDDARISTVRIRK
jgi:hypothetical protein